MILCIDTHAIEARPNMQKDVKLVDLVLNHTKYYESAAEAEKDYYVPLSFSTSVRTVYNNTVLQIKEGDSLLYYVTHTNVGQFVHKGYDLIAYLAAIGLMSFVEYDYAFDDMMATSSVLQPIGLYNPDPGFTNPIVYSHIIIKDEAEDTLKSFLKPDVKLVPIKDIDKKGNLSALTDTLIIVEKKGDKENE